MNRGDRQQVQTTPGAPGHSAGPGSHKSSKLGNNKLGKVGFVGFIVVLTVLIVAVIFSLVTGAGSGGSKEAEFVDKNKFQAVFLNGGQVYFGKVEDLSARYLKLNNIYYLRVNQQVQPGQTSGANDISLVKLGCELHGPDDSMLINREQVIFWENLKDDGQVAKAVAEYVKQNPDGQKCEQQQQQSGGTNTNPAPATTNTTPTTNKPATGTTTR